MMIVEETSGGEDEPHALIRRLFRWHVLAYCAVIGALTIVNILVGGGWWSFWPTCAWGLVLAFHFFYFKSVTVDDSWVQERTDDLRLRSYDLSHIRDIEERVDSGDSSVRPADRRDT